jgi:hypothetical protein
MITLHQVHLPIRLRSQYAGAVCTPRAVPKEKGGTADNTSRNEIYAMPTQRKIPIGRNRCACQSNLLCSNQASNLRKIKARPVCPWMLLSFSGHQGQYRGHQDVWKFYSVAILKFQIRLSFHETRKMVQNSNNIQKNAKQNYGYFNTWLNRQTDGKVHLNTILNLLPILQIIHLVFESLSTAVWGWGQATTDRGFQYISRA